MGNPDDSENEALLPGRSPAPADKAPYGLHGEPTDGEDATTPPKITPKHCSGWRPGVELSALLYIFNLVVSMSATQQFIYVKIANELNYTGPKPGEPMTDNCTEANTSDPLYMKQQEVQDVASAWYTYNSMCLSLTAFFTTVFLGGYSDRGGRKITLLFPLIGSLCRSIIYLFVTIYDLPKFVILIGSVLEGLSGYLTTFMMGAQSYICDQTSHTQRSFRIVVLEAVTGIATLLATFCGGFMIVGIGFLGVYVVVLVIVTANILFVLLALKESKPLQSPNAARNQSERRGKIFSCGHFTRAFVVFRGVASRQPHYLPMLLLGLFALLPVSLVLFGRTGVIALYFFNTPFCWSSVFFGVYMSVTFSLTVVGALGVTKLLQKRIGDLNLLHMGLISIILNAIFLGLARSVSVALIAAVLGALLMLPFGMLRSFLSKVVKPDEIGALFSWVAWTESIGGLLGNVVFNSVYHATLFWMNSFVYYLIAALTGVSVVLTGLLQWKTWQSRTATKMLKDPEDYGAVVAIVE